MKKKYFILFAVGLMGLGCFARTPAKKSYQAVIRNGDGKLIANSRIGIKISLWQGSTTESPIHADRKFLKANANGLVSFVIGEGDIVSGDFKSMYRAQGAYFIKTSTEPTGGANYTITDTTPLLSVPYALYAKLAETVSGTVDASQITNLGDLSGGGVNGTESAFTNWDKDATDDLSGVCYFFIQMIFPAHKRKQAAPTTDPNFILLKKKIEICVKFLHLIGKRTTLRMGVAHI